MGNQNPAGDIAANLAHARSRIAQACIRAGRVPEDVTLIAVTKTQNAAQIVQAYQAGAREFGENYVQEALSKVGQPPLDWPDVTWHFIGHLQSNKAREIVSRFALIQSVDSVKLAHEIARRALQQNRLARILLEVKLDPAPAKFGFAPDRVLEDVAQIQQADGLALCGLMGMAPFDPDPEQARPGFQRLAALYAQLPPACRQVLSMGMSGDFEVAIEEGATHVRIGTAIFGQRP